MSEENIQNGSNNISETQQKDANSEASVQTKELTETKALAEKYKNEYLYLRAEFDNYKKHVIKERADLLKYGNENAFVELLNILDNFERALEVKVAPENLDAVVKGIRMTETEFKKTLNKFGVSEVETMGKPFDPAIHEALSAEETDQVPNGHIARVFKKAYKLHDKIIRPAQVIVAKPKAGQ